MMRSEYFHNDWMTPSHLLLEHLINFSLWSRFQVRGEGQMSSLLLKSSNWEIREAKIRSKGRNLMKHLLQRLFRLTAIKRQIWSELGGVSCLSQP